MNNLSERCSYCIHSVGEHDMFYLDCDAPEDYRCSHEVCPYFETEEEKMVEYECPKCGGESEFVKLSPRVGYAGFMLCKECGYEGRCYASKQAAVKNWKNKDKHKNKE